MLYLQVKGLQMKGPMMTLCRAGPMEGDDSGPEFEQDVTDGAAAQAPDSPLCCRVFAQCYEAETHQLYVQFPDSVRRLKEIVARHRSVDRAGCLPQLLSVFPQPFNSAATLLAIPDWDTATVPVLIQVLGREARQFAVFVPARLSCADVCNLAGFRRQGAMHVFVRDVPWPHDGRYLFQVNRRDLVTICPAGTSPPAMYAIEDLLSEPTDGLFSGPAPVMPQGGVWLLADTGDSHYHARPSRHRTFP